MTAIAKNLRKPRSRDIFDFINIRTATRLDERAVGNLLVTSFAETNARKNPGVATSPERIAELQDVRSRRQNGEVVIIEFGYRIIGTFTLIRPGSSLAPECWLKNAALLRCVAIDPEFHGLGFSEILLAESERLAQSWSASYICLHVQQGADGVAKLYRRRGYERDPSGDFDIHGYRVEAYALSLKRLECVRVNS